MTRQEKNEQFLLSSFLYGGNAAYIEDLYARYKTDPASIDPTWASYFGRLEDSAADVAEERRGPVLGARGLAADAPMATWFRRSTAIGARSSSRRRRALVKKAEADGAPAPTPVDVLQATRDSIRAIMMIRAYRTRGHLHADLDPLQSARRTIRRPSSIPRPTASPRPITAARSSSTTVLGLEFATAPADARRSCSAPIARPSASSSCTSTILRPSSGSRNAWKGPTRRSSSRPRARRRSSTS